MVVFFSVFRGRKFHCDFASESGYVGYENSVVFS